MRPPGSPTLRSAAAWAACALWVVPAAAGGGPADSADSADSADAEMRFFEERVRPLLATHCFECHAGDEFEGDLRLDSRGGLLAGGWSGPAVVPGDPDASLLLEAVRYESYEMPPDAPLPAADVAVLAKWVELGAPWPGANDAPPVREKSPGDRFTDEDRAWWALRPLSDPAPPAADPGFGHWARNGIDRFVQAKLREAGLAPAPEADRVTLIRRVTQDLTGLPPTPAQIDAFLADRRPDAYERLVDRLLADPAHGERWAGHWLDLVRYADSDGYRNDHLRPDAWRYRDYVIGRLNADVPYDRFVREQLAADELYPDDSDALVGLGLLRHGIYEHNSRDALGQRELMLDELTDTTADAFLGLGLRCARCHDHKFDPLLQTDFYRLRAYFEPLLFRDRAVAATPGRGAERAERLGAWEAATAGPRAELETIFGPARERARDKAVDKFPEEVRAMYRTPDADRTPYERQVAWFVHDQVRQEWAKVEDLSGYLSGEEKARAAALREAIAAFDRLRPDPPPTVLAATDAAATAPPTVVPRRNTEVAPGPIALLSGPDAPLPPTDPAPLPPGAAADLADSVLDGEEPPGRGSTGRRSALADWIADPRNPLTTRVIVNRVWQRHLGRGLAPNPSDFGRLGGPPSHPALLDWLTARFLENGWRLKPLHRLIVTSATYRQSAAHPRRAAQAAADPRNRLYWRADVRRLGAEQVRDALLTVTGSVRRTAGGPGAGHGEPVRSVYLERIRNRREALMDLFDLPQFFVSTAARDTTTSPLQSLHLINSESVSARAGRLADRAGPVRGDGAGAVRTAWRLALGSEPTGAQVARGVRFLREQTRRTGAGDASAGDAARRAAFADFCHVLLNSSAFLYVP